MAEQKKKKGRKAYLNDFKKNQEGVYTYEGEHYVWQGTAASLKKARLLLGLLGAGMLAASLGAGCAPAPGAQICAYVLLPYVIGLVCTINLCWKLGRLIAAGGEVRAYVYKAAAEGLPVRAVLVAVFAGLSMAGELVCAAINGLSDKVPGFLLFLLLEGITMAGGILLFSFGKNMAWKPPKKIN